MTHISQYLDKVTNVERFDLKKYDEDKFNGARSAFVECCKTIVPGWKDHYPDVTDKLVRYSIQSDKFEGDLTKGILLMGNTGLGKTVYLKALSLFMGYTNKFKFKIYTGFEMERIYMTDPSSQENFKLNSDLNAKMFGIDDLGEEHSSIKRFGTEINVGVDTLTQRHQLFTDKGYRTLATSNLNAEMIAKKYGKRIESRAHEMFNFIGVHGNDLRKLK